MSDLPRIVITKNSSAFRNEEVRATNKTLCAG